MAVPVMAIVGGREMRDGRVSLRERDGSQADVPLAEAVSRLQARARAVAVPATCKCRWQGCLRRAIYRHIPRMRAPISSFGPCAAARAAAPAGATGQAVRSNRPSSFSGMKRVRDA